MSSVTPQISRRLARRSFSTGQSGILAQNGEVKRQTKGELALEREKVKQVQRRVEKAERDERMDITKALSDVKTFRGGFSRPQLLRSSNWWKGGAYVEKGKNYEDPMRSAYQPHTVLLLESRYPINMPVDRPDSYEHILVALPSRSVDEYLASTRDANFKRATLDKAQWPWLPKKNKRTKWWTDPEERHSALAELRGEIDLLSLEKAGATPTVEAGASGGPSPNTARNIGTLLASGPSRSPMQPGGQVRFYSMRAPPDKSDDDVPEYYIGRKRQREAIAERKEQEGDLMYELSAGIIADALSATTQRSQPKIPVEFTDEHGSIRHPSGFEVPEGTGRETDSPVFDRRKSRKEYKEQQTAGVRERVREMAGLKDEGVKNIVEGGVKPREEKIPVEIPHADGTVSHPSGFVPPVPNTSFTYGVKNGRAFHSSAAARAMPLDGKVPLIGEPQPVKPLDEYELRLQELREHYEPTLQSQPFWRPLLKIECSTRPLAESVRRLSTALPRGLPYIAAIDPKERLDANSQTARIRCMRIARMQQLTKETAELLAGYRGGFVGIRFGTEERGRAVDGEGLEAPVPKDKRALKVGVASWYKRGEEVREGFEMDADHLGDGVETYMMDEFGRKVGKDKS